MRIGSLFSGYGGLDMAVQSVIGGEVAWVSDIEPASCRVLAAHHPGVPNLGDITTVSWLHVQRDHGPIDVLTAGYPCQPFSHAGKRQGENDERHLWLYVRSAIRFLRPRLVVLENVRGHLSMGLADVIGDLAGVGYDARWGVVRAADAGAPHNRARVFIVAHPDGSRRDQDVEQPGYIGAAPGEGQPGVPDGHCADGDAARGVSAADADGSGSQGADSLRRNDARTSGAQCRSAVAAIGVAADTDDSGDPKRAESAGSQHGAAEPVGGGPATDTFSGRRIERSSERQSARDPGGPEVSWGKYAPAIARWESVLGRPAPSPTIPGANGRPRLSPAFVEWMMGLPAGHVTGHGLRPAQELKMLGNGVVPQQAALALRMLGVAP